MADTKDDGKIRMRCHGCGHRVKFPANQPGATLRCPICHKVIIAPLIGEEPKLDLEADLTTPAPPASPPAAGRTADFTAPAPQSMAKAAAVAPVRKPSAMERLNVFLVKETDRVGRLALEALSNSSNSVEEQARTLQALRHAKAVRFKDYAQGILKDLDGEIAEIRKHPAPETASVQQKLNRLLLERRGLLIFLNVMFEFRAGAPGESRKAATPSTPGNAAALPTTPLPPAAQTPPGKAAASPAPGSINPGSSASPSC